MSNTIEQAIQQAINLLTSDDSRPVRVGLSNFWDAFKTLPGFDRLDRQTVLDRADAVYLTSEQFILCRWVREAALAFLQNQSSGMAMSALWGELGSRDLLPKHTSSREKLLGAIEAIRIEGGGNNLIIHVNFVHEAVQSTLEEAKEHGLKITEIRTQLESRNVLPTEAQVLQDILASVSVKIENRFYHPNHRPSPAVKRQNSNGSEPTPAQKIAQKLLRGEDGAVVVWLDLEEFLLGLMDAGIDVPDNVLEGQNPGATYSLLNNLGVIEVDGNKVVLLQHVADAFEQILRNAGSKGIAKDDMWTKLQEAGLQPAFRLGKAQLPKKPFAVKRDGEMYFHTDFAPPVPGPNPEPEPVKLEPEALPVTPDPTPITGLVAEPPLDEDPPVGEAVTDQASGTFAGLAHQMLQTLTPDMMSALGLKTQVTLGGVTAALLPVLQREDAERLLLEVHLFPGGKSDAVHITGHTGDEQHTYGRVAAVVVLRYQPGTNGSSGHKEN